MLDWSRTPSTYFSKWITLFLVKTFNITMSLTLNLQQILTSINSSFWHTWVTHMCSQICLIFTSVFATIFEVHKRLFSYLNSTHWCTTWFTTYQCYRILTSILNPIYSWKFLLCENDCISTTYLRIWICPLHGFKPCKISSNKFMYLTILSLFKKNLGFTTLRYVS